MATLSQALINNFHLYLSDYSAGIVDGVFGTLLVVVVLGSLILKRG